MPKFNLKTKDWLSSVEGKRRYNHRLFSAIAPEYPTMSRVLSLGRDQAWKRQLISALPDRQTKPNCLDLACGNGDLCAMLMQKYPQAALTALDLAAPMLALARHRLGDFSEIKFMEGDMTSTGLPAGTYDIVTVGYGLRNAPNLDQALAEIFRVLKPGGSVGVLDFSRFNQRWLSAVELWILRLWCGMWGVLRSGNADTYGYIAASLARYPTRSLLHDKLAAHGLQIQQARRRFFGIVEIIVALKPSSQDKAVCRNRCPHSSPLSSNEY